MAQSRSLELSNLSPDDIAVARRIREERQAQRLSFSAFARETGIPRSGLSNYEYGIAAVPFDVAMQICRRLDLSPRWLATGAEPKQPFIDADSLGVPSVELPARKPFSDVYKAHLAFACETWFLALDLQGSPPELHNLGPIGLLRRLSDRSLFQFARQWFVILSDEGTPREKLGTLETVEMALGEMRQRWENAAKTEKRGTVEEKDLAKGSQWDLSGNADPITPMQISEKIRSILKKQNLTQKEAAEKWGIPVKTLKNWVQGLRQPRGLALAQLKMIFEEEGKSLDANLKK